MFVSTITSSTTSAAGAAVAATTVTSTTAAFAVATLYVLVCACVYSRVPGSRNWQVETADWILAGFLHYF